MGRRSNRKKARRLQEALVRRDESAVVELEEFLDGICSDDEDEALALLSEGASVQVQGEFWSVFWDPADGWSAYGTGQDPEDLDNPHAQRELHISDPRASAEAVVTELQCAMSGSP